MSLNISNDQILTEESQQRAEPITVLLKNNKDEIVTEENHQIEEPNIQSELQLNKPKNVFGSFIYDIELLENPLDNSLFHRRVRPEVRQQFLCEQRKYTFLKKFAILHLKATLWRQINCLFYQCQNQSDEPDEKITHEIFSWSFDDFLKRRSLDNFVWLDVMLKSSAMCLEKFKFKKDLEELRCCLELVFEGLLSDIDDATIDQIEHLLKHTSNIQKLLQYSNNIEQEFRDNKKTLTENNLINTSTENIKQDTEDHFVALMLQTRISNHHIWTPVEQRFQFSWYQSQVIQGQYHMAILEEKYLKDIVTQNKNISLESACANSCMDFFYTSIENIKRNTDSIQAKFDEAAENMENIINFKRARLDKLRDQRKFLSKQIIRYHEEIEAKQKREEKEAAAVNNLILKEEEKEVAAKKPEEQIQNKIKGKESKGKNKQKTKIK